jgi:hypothetical protein
MSENHIIEEEKYNKIVIKINGYERKHQHKTFISVLT